MKRAAAILLVLAAPAAMLPACDKGACEDAPPSVHFDLVAKNGLETRIVAVEMIFTGHDACVRTKPRSRCSSGSLQRTLSTTVGTRAAYLPPRVRLSTSRP